MNETPQNPGKPANGAGGAGPKTAAAKPAPAEKPKARPKEKPKEIGGPKGPEPTRYGDWERKGRCVDF